MSGKFGLVNDLSILLAGRRVKWGAQAVASGAPASNASGVYLQNSPVTVIAIDVRDDPARRTDRITIETLDLTATYGVTVNASTASFNAGTAGATSLADVLEGWAAAVNASGAVSAVVTASADLTEGSEALVLTGVGEAQYDLTIQGNGTSKLALAGEPTHVLARIWSRASQNDGSPPAGWRCIETLTVDRRGFERAFRSSGVDRFYVAIDEADAPTGDASSAPHTRSYAPARIRIGPAILEAT